MHFLPVTCIFLAAKVFILIVGRGLLLNYEMERNNGGLGLHESNRVITEGPREASLVWQAYLQYLIFPSDATLLGLLLKLLPPQVLYVLLQMLLLKNKGDQSTSVST